MTIAGVEDFLYAVERDEEIAVELFEKKHFFTALSLVRARFANLGPLAASEIRALSDIKAANMENYREACQGTGLLGKER